MAAEEMPARLLRLMEEASYCREQGDLQGAYDKLSAARILYDSTPDQERGGNSLKRRSIEELLNQVKADLQEQRRGRGIQQQKIEYRNPTCY